MSAADLTLTPHHGALPAQKKITNSFPNFLRRIGLLVASALIATAAASHAHAADLSASDVLIPIAARTPGAHGSEWRTDLTVTNASFDPAEVVIRFVPGGSSTELSITRTMEPHETLLLDDVILTTFHREEAHGWIRITSPDPTAAISANGRIYNIGSAHGEFGQGVQALPVDALIRNHYLTGLTGLGPNRTNVGISNPWEIETSVTIGLYDRDGLHRGSFNTVIAARQARQFNDIFAHFQAGPLEGATVRITSEFGVYTYASIVRSDSGDARLITGTGFARGHGLLEPAACTYAAPVVLIEPGRTPAEGWIVKLQDIEADPIGRTAYLADRYGFSAEHIFEELKGFYALLTPSQIAALRCDADVRWIRQNSEHNW